MMHCGRALCAILVLGAMLAAGCAVPPARVPAAEGGLRYAFVVLGEEGAAVARAITAAAQCPAVVVDGAALPMTARARPATRPPRPTVNGAADSKASDFPVLVCDRTIPAGTARASIEGRELPVPKAAPQRIVVIGDTGCRLQKASGVHQACNDRDQWPFARVAAAAAAQHPDLVVHVGDYHYRETACPEGNAGCTGSPWGYGWDAWDADFFAPAQALLAVAPWIVVRGNHESCARAGQGWWRLVDPRPLAPHRDCNDPADDAIGDYSEPYAVPLGTSAAADTQLIVFDSSLVGIKPLPPESAMYRNYREQFEQAFALAARRPQAFVMFHHPVLAFAANPAKPDGPYPGNAGLQSVLQTLQPTVLFPPTVQALLSGHMHDFQVVSFVTPQPVQLVSGNGGDWLDDPLPSPLPAGLEPSPGAVVAVHVSTNRFGFMTIERAGAGWTMTERGADGVPVATCALASRKASCTPSTLR